MALTSPGVDVTVIDESQYAPNAAGTVPFILLATAQNKISSTGAGVAIGTTKINAEKVSLVTSQRELGALFGNPIFKRTASGTPIHGSEFNEYGLMTAHSLLGVTNRVYVQRADIDLAELEGSAVRPTNDPADGAIWFDTATTSWGLFEWNNSTQSFAAKNPLIIDSEASLTANIPASRIGVIGDYAVVTTNANNPMYYKKYDNTWVLVGSQAWQSAHFSVQAQKSYPTVVIDSSLIINGVSVPMSGVNVASAASDISNAGIAGIVARNNNGKLEIYVDGTASSPAAAGAADGIMTLDNGVGTPLTVFGIDAGSYTCPKVHLGSHVSVPRWRKSDPMPRPTGSLWCKTTSANAGANYVLSAYSKASDSFVSLAAPIYPNDQSALKSLDPIGGGVSVAAGSIFVQSDVLADNTLTFKLLKRAKQGTTSVTGSAVAPTFTVGDQFSIAVSQTGVAVLTPEVSITLNDTTASSFVTDVLAANIPNLVAQISAAGAITLTHTKGGVIVLKNLRGQPLVTAGITTSSTSARAGNNSELIISNFETFAYTASAAAPNSDPENGRMWYYSEVGDVDIMIHNGTKWVGYQNETADARGYNLSQTNPTGPIVSASEPAKQVDGTALVYGDLWVSTGDLDNFPIIYRYTNVAGAAKWVLLNNADQTTEDGVLFADARWDMNGKSNVIVDALTPVGAMLTSDYLDLDAPDAELYPRGTLLFNTRRSSFNVKKFIRNYFNADKFVGTLPVERDSWVSAAGLKDDGSPYMGRQSVRRIITIALNGAIASSVALREEQRAFTLIATPGYPELIPNMISLNNDRRNTAFIVGDSPLRLSASAGDVQDWANDVNKAGTGEFGLANSDPYLGIYYPGAQTTDLDGNSIVMPASYIALRTIIRSDNVSYPWFAAAGTRRGLVDNASAIGYIDSATGEFNRIGVTEGLRDTLYESRINPITFLTGVGLVVYGNKTVGVSGSALDRINVSRLTAYLRVVIDAASKNFVFEPNDKITRDELKQVVERVLNDLMAKRALTDYVVVCDESNNTPLRRDRNELYVDVAIEPIKAAEFIYVPLRIKGQGVLSGS